MNLKNVSDADEKKKKEEKQKKLQDWCKEKSGSVYRSLFNSEDTKLLELVKELCTYSIKRKIGNVVEKEDDVKIDGLKDKKEKLPQELKEIEGIIDKNEKKQEIQKKIFGWCRKNLGKGYEGENDETYTKVKEFCKKS